MPLKYCPAAPPPGGSDGVGRFRRGRAVPTGSGTIVREFVAESRVLVLQIEDSSDADDVDALDTQARHPTDAGEIVVAVSARASVAARRRDQALRLEEPQARFGDAAELGGDGDAVHRHARITV